MRNTLFFREDYSMVELIFEKISRFDRPAEFCSVAIPFPKGILKESEKTVIVDGDKVVPSQERVTAYWPDGSIKWLLIHFLADLPGNKGKSLYCKLIESDKLIPENPVSIAIEANGTVITSGDFRVGLKQAGESGVFSFVDRGGVQFKEEEIVGPMLYHSDGEPFFVHIGEKGWEVIESGPIRAVLQTCGKHCSETGEEWMDYVLRVYAFAGKPWIQLEYQIINREEGERQRIKGMTLSFHPIPKDSSQIRKALATSNYLSNIRKSSGEEKLNFLIDADYVVYDANEHIPETFYGTFWADWYDKSENRGVCATLYQAYQNLPKSLEVDACGLNIGILPKDFVDYQLWQGMARTHRLFLHFHGAEETPESLNVRSLQFQMPDRAAISPKVYQEAGVFENIFVEKKVDWVERALLNMADSRARTYGFLHWGDAPDMGYTIQGRGKGEPVWTNNEYDFPHAAMLMYAKTSERRMLDYMLVAAQHWMDVDICHYSKDPLRYKGQIEHSANHVTGDVIPCHQWVEGLLDFYHQTGEISAYEAAIGIGENILRLLELPRYQGKGEINARETGWALRSLIALFKETNDKKWLQPADRIIGHFEAWKEELGGWFSPYTDHTVIRIPFMISVAVNSLMRYYRIKPQERVKAMILDAVKDLVDNCRFEDGQFFYKELPSLRKPTFNSLILEALAYAYDLSGDVEFLKAGIPTFENITEKGREGGSGKKKLDETTVLLSGPGPKSFAQSLHAIAYYYRSLVEAGLL